MTRLGRLTVCALALLAGTAGLQFEPKILSDLVVDQNGNRLAVGAIRTPLWSVAFAQSPESLNLENVSFTSGSATYEAKRIEFTGLTSSRADIDALLSSTSAQSMESRLARINAKQILIPDLKIRQTLGPETQTITHKNVVFKDIVRGKVGEIVAETSGAEMTGGADKTVFSYGRSSLRELDLPALAHLYESSAPSDPAPMVKIHGGFSVENFGLLDEAEGVQMNIARVSGSDFLARPIPGSWQGATSLLAEFATKKEISPADQGRLIGIVADLLGAFDFGLVEATGFEMKSNGNAKNGNDKKATAKIARMAYRNGTASQPADGRLEGFEVTDQNGSVSIASLSLTGFSITPMLEGLKKLQGQSLDDIDAETARSLAPTFGTLKVAGIGIDSSVVGDAGATSRVKSTIKELEFTADKPLNGIPTNVRFGFQNFAVALPAQSDADGIKDLLALGYKNLDVSFLLAGTWNETTSELAVRDLSLQGTDMANLSASGTLGNVSKDVFDPDNAIASVALMGARVKQLDLRVENTGLFERFLAKTAKEEKTTPDALRQAYGLGAAILVPSVIGNSEQASRISQAIARFVAKPGRSDDQRQVQGPGGPQRCRSHQRVGPEGDAAKARCECRRRIIGRGSRFSAPSPIAHSPSRACASTTAIAVRLTMPRAVTDGVRMCAGFAGPIRIGPTGSESARILVNWKAMLAASRFGMMRTFASPFRREVG